MPLPPSPRRIRRPLLSSLDAWQFPAVNCRGSQGCLSGIRLLPWHSRQRFHAVLSGTLRIPRGPSFYTTVPSALVEPPCMPQLCRIPPSLLFFFPFKFPFFPVPRRRAAPLTAVCSRPRLPSRGYGACARWLRRRPLRVPAKMDEPEPSPVSVMLYYV